VLAFVALKMLAGRWIDVPITNSLAVMGGILAACSILSWMRKTDHCPLTTVHCLTTLRTLPAPRAPKMECLRKRSSSRWGKFIAEVRTAALGAGECGGQNGVGDAAHGQRLGQAAASLPLPG